MAFVTFPGQALKRLPRAATSTSRPCRKAYALSPRMGIRAVESYDGSFKLSEQVDRDLNTLLLDANLGEYVAKQAKRESAEYMGILFQPVPYSVATPHGMPEEIEEYYKNPDFAIINIPPQVMFKAKCAKPSRLCAVFRVQGGVREEEEPVIPKKQDHWTGIGDAIRNPVTDTGEDAPGQVV